MVGDLGATSNLEGNSLGRLSLGSWGAGPDFTPYSVADVVIRQEARTDAQMASDVLAMQVDHADLF
jgi:hypothetical protein